jgi:hypothetical protein
MIRNNCFCRCIEADDGLNLGDLLRRKDQRLMINSKLEELNWTVGDLLLGKEDQRLVNSKIRRNNTSGEPLFIII